jgi:hypothetical protein
MGTEDGTVITRAYGEQLSAVQEKLVSAQTDADRLQHQTKLSERFSCRRRRARYVRAHGAGSGAFQQA